MNRAFGVILFAISVILVVGLIVMLVGNSSTTSTGNTNTGTTNTGSTGQNTGKITLTQLALHNTQADCWVLYQGKVYDLTSWLPKHPGSPGAILPYCGNTGFEAAFTEQHGTSQVEKLMKEGVYKGDFQ